VAGDHNAAQKHASRARIVLLTADGLGTNMRRTAKSKAYVWRWQQRFMEQGPARSACATRTWKHLALEVRARGRGDAPVNRLAWRVEAATYRMIGATCLRKALALRRLLARNGQNPEVGIGVDKRDEKIHRPCLAGSKRSALCGGAARENYKWLAALATDFYLIFGLELLAAHQTTSKE